MISPRVNMDIVRERIGAYAEQDYTQDERFAICNELIGLVPPRRPATERGATTMSGIIAATIAAHVPTLGLDTAIARP